MFATAMLLPAIGLASVAMAQGSPCSASATTTVSNLADITSCPSFTGSIELAPSLVNVDLGSLTAIRGDLITESSNVTTLMGNQLRSISGAFRISSSLALNSVSFPQLSMIGSVDWDAVPELATLSFGPGVQEIDSFTIRDSQITDLSSINLKSAQTVSISNCRYLRSLNWQTGNITKELTLDSNGLGGANGFSAHFPNLQTVGAVSINQVNSLDFSSLTNASTMSIYRTTISELAFPNLTTVGGSLVLDTDNNLMNISFPQLMTINGPLVINNSDALTGNVTFPKLKSMSSLFVEGAMSGLSLPSVSNIAGLVTVISTDKNFDCSAINMWPSQGITKAKPSVCKAAAPASNSTTGSGSGSGTGTNSGAGASGSTGAASRVALGSASLLGAGGLFAAMLGMM